MKNPISSHGNFLGPLLALFFSFYSMNGVAGTRITNVYGNGTGFGFCNGINYSFCSYQLKSNSERDASDQLSTSCAMQKGTLQSFPYCTTNCFPGFLPQNAPMQTIDCRSECTGTCEIVTL